MKNKLLKILPFIGIITLGVYTTIQFLLNKPIEPHTGLVIILVMVLLLSIADEKND